MGTPKEEYEQHRDNTQYTSGSYDAYPDVESGDTHRIPSGEEMKKLTQIWSEYREYTEDFTAHSRKLAFAGVAVCWLFKSGDFTFPPLIYISLLTFVGFFVADTLQMFTGAMMRRFFAEYHEKKNWKEKETIDAEVFVPRWLDSPAFALFCVKAALLTIGFACIGVDVLMKLVGQH